MCSDKIKKCLSIPVFVLLGEASYSLYLIHIPVWNAFIGLGGSGQSIGYGIYILALVAASIVVYFVIERPFRWWIRHLFKGFMKKGRRFTSALPGRAGAVFAK